MLANGACIELPEGARASATACPVQRLFGQPDLEPMRSWQYDLTAEWYINSTNSLTGAIFYKHVEGFTGDLAELCGDYTNNGQTRTVRVLQPGEPRQWLRARLRGRLTTASSISCGASGRTSGARAAFTYVESGGTRNVAANPYDQNQRDNSALDDYPLEGLSKTGYNAGALLQRAALRGAAGATTGVRRYVLTMAAAI